MGDQTLIGAIDIGGTKVAVGLVSHDGHVLCRRELRTADLPNPTIALAAIESALTQCLHELDTPLCGIGIGCTGPIDPATGVIGKVANLPGWQGWPIVDQIHAAFRVPTAMENDADACALAEATWGSGVGIERFLYITISTGIGAGFVYQGKLYRGAGGSHQEMGHHTIDPSGPLCYCGARGCWESLASGKAIEEWFASNDPARRFTSESFTAQTLFELHRQGDFLAQAAITRLGFYLGLGLANLTTVLVPDVITLGGGVMRGAAAFLDSAIELRRRVCGEVPAENSLVRLAALHHDVDLAGAAAVWIQLSRSPM